MSVADQHTTAEPSKGRYKTISKGDGEVRTSPSRWNTWEFYFYYLCFVVVVPYMFYIGHYVSREDNPNHSKYQDLLSPGWIRNRKVDNSDAQYANFRDNIKILVPLLCVYLILSHTYRYFVAPAGTPIKHPSQKLYRTYFFLSTSIIFLIITNGTSVLKILSIASFNYAIAKTCRGSRSNPILTWIFNLTILFMNEQYNGYEFGWIDGRLQFLDSYKGINPRWHILFNFTMLRLISFNMDYYWSFQVTRDQFDKEDRNGGPTSDRDRINGPCFAEDYNFVYYLAYALYTPLYLAGPIITYNNFISQLRYPSKDINVKSTIIYAIRLVCTILTMELILHYMYVVAISKRKAWEGDSPLEMSMIGYWNLKIIWLKLLIPWRFFRLWAMADGIATDENMVRCMSNNYSAQGFWKSWHRSYNRWTVRYIYIPLGGSKYFMYNMWIVFTFVAIWHDIQLRLLAWGWLICLFLLPEVLATAIFSPRKWGDWPYYRHLCACGAVLNILMMMIANLIGFCVGLDGMQDMLQSIFMTPSGLSFLLATCFCLFVAVQLMFEIRESEKRRGDSKWKM